MAGPNDLNMMLQNPFLRKIALAANPNAAGAAPAETGTDADQDLIGAGDDGGTSGYRQHQPVPGSSEQSSDVPPLFAFAAKPASPAAGSSPDLATNPRQPKPSIGQLQRREQNPPQFHNGAIVGLMNHPDARTQAQVGEDAEPVPQQNNFGVPYGGEGELGVLSGVGESTVPNEIAAETPTVDPTLAEQGSTHPLIRGLQKLFGMVGQQPEPGQKYDPASAPSHRIAENLLQRIGNAGAAIGFSTDPRELRLKQQEVALEIKRLDEELAYHQELYGDRDARTQLLAQRLQDMQNYHNGLLDKLSQKTVEKFNPDTNQVELYGWSDKDQDYTRPMGLAGHQPKTSAQAAPSRPFVMGTKLYRYPTPEEQANGQNDPVLLGDAPAKNSKGSAAGSLNALKPTKGPNGNYISVYDPATKQNYFPQDVNDPNLPFYIAQFWKNVAANQKEPTKSKSKGKIVF